MEISTLTYTLTGLEMNLYHEVHVSYSFLNVVVKAWTRGRGFRGRVQTVSGRTISRMLTVVRLLWVENWVREFEDTGR